MFKLCYRKISALYLRLLSFIGIGIRSSTGDEELDKIIENAGYSYDPKKDMFYSNMNAWQRSMGYCRLYDEAAAPLGMIVDCEPIYFEYDNKRWLIELWKGQYDLTTGCEIGIYTTKEPDLDIAGIFKGPFYNCASDEDLLQVSFSLIKKEKVLFEREERHWWLTGFKLGEFSEPSELTMNASITLKDEIMRNAFLEGIKKAGYLESELIINANTISLKFDKTRTPQPTTRIPETDEMIQWKNKLMCIKYRDITGEYTTFPEKINALKNHAPELYELIKNIGKTKEIYEISEAFKKYLNS